MASNTADVTSGARVQGRPAAPRRSRRGRRTRARRARGLRPEPRLAERVRTLLHVGRTGTLATLSRRHAGLSVRVGDAITGSTRRPPDVPDQHDGDAHTEPRERRAREPARRPSRAGPRIRSPARRATLVGRVDPLPRTPSRAVRDDYLERHENARYWVDFDEFGFWRMAVERDAISSAASARWAGSRPHVPRGRARSARDASAQAIIEHMNADHADALILIRAATSATSRRRGDNNQRGIRLRIQVGCAAGGSPAGDPASRFPRRCASADDARRAFVAMVREARNARGEGGAR